MLWQIICIRCNVRNKQMKIFKDISQIPEFKNPVLSIGSFDGVHLGHQEILRVMKECANTIHGETVLLTFWPHPRMVLQPDNNALKLLNTIEEKTGILEKSGLENLVILPFTEDFSKMDYRHFIEEILVKILKVKTLVIGHDHHFGKNREGNYAQLENLAPIYHFDLVQVDAIQVQSKPLSSSMIRMALENNNPVLANEILGYTYAATGIVVEGKKRGKELGYPTANIHIPEKFKLLPGDGIYVVEVIHNGITYKGMASLGQNPTFGDTGKTLEINIFNFDKQIYGEKITVKFLLFLRKEVKFASKEELVQQLDADKRDTLFFFQT